MSQGRIKRSNLDRIDERERHVIYYGAEIDENDPMLEREGIDSFVDDFNTPRTITLDTKWWAYAIIAVGVVIATYLFMMVYLTYIKRLW